MKKIVMAALLCALFAACGGDDGLGTTPQKPPTNQEKPEVKGEELEKFFNLDKQLNVYQALQKAKADVGKKTIDGKEINVTAVSEVKRDEQAGTFTLKVTGKVGTADFEKEVDFAGFAKKPTDLEMAKRVVATWKTDVDYQTQFDFDALYRLKQTDKFTVEYLSKFVDFTSSSTDGSNRYTFNAEDLAQTKVTGVKYEADNSHAGRITFTLEYKGTKSETKSGPSLAFDKNLYYQGQVTVNADAAKALYMRGAYEFIDIFRSSLLKYDSQKFVPLIVHKVKSDSDNSFSLTLKLTANDGKETELAQFALVVAGFKPLNDLNEEFSLSNSSDLADFFTQRFKSSADGDKSAQVKAIDVKLWFNKVQMFVKRGGGAVELASKQVKSENGNYNVTVWVPSETGSKNKDIYLEEPKIEVLGARKEGVWLYINYKLTAVNDVAIDGKGKEFQVHLK